MQCIILLHLPKDQNSDANIAQRKCSAAASPPLHSAPRVDAQLPACRPRVRQAAATEEGRAQHPHTCPLLSEVGPWSGVCFQNTGQSTKLTAKWNRGISQPSKKKDTKIRQNDRGTNEPTIKRKRDKEKEGIRFPKAKAWTSSATKYISRVVVYMPKNLTNIKWLYWYK